MKLSLEASELKPGSGRGNLSSWPVFAAGRCRVITTFLALAVVTALTQACTRTYIGTGGSGVPSPDGSYRVTIKAHGAYGRSYIDETKKGILVRVWRGSGQNSTETLLYSEKYTFVGSDLGFHVQWSSTEKVIVDLYDYGPGVSSYDARKAGAPSNHIGTLAFRLDKHTGMFEPMK